MTFQDIIKNISDSLIDKYKERILTDEDKMNIAIDDEQDAALRKQYFFYKTIQNKEHSEQKQYYEQINLHLANKHLSNNIDVSYNEAITNVKNAISAVTLEFADARALQIDPEWQPAARA